MNDFLPSLIFHSLIPICSRVYTYIIYTSRPTHTCMLIIKILFQMMTMLHITQIPCETYVHYQKLVNELHVYLLRSRQNITNQKIDVLTCNCVKQTCKGVFFREFALMHPCRQNGRFLKINELHTYFVLTRSMISTIFFFKELLPYTTLKHGYDIQ